MKNSNGSEKLCFVDIFAGAGGLGEGFAQAGIRPALSCDADMHCVSTLRLRRFFHCFSKNRAPATYYDYLRGNVPLEELNKKHRHEWEEAENSVLACNLGQRLDNLPLHERIRSTVQNDDLILLGGPPCQAYSIAGRSRRLGIGNRQKNKDELAKEFYTDERHTLYLTYLEVIAFHKPKVFVFENVRGLLSAKSSVKSDSGSVFNNIIDGLRNPADILHQLGYKKNDLGKRIGKSRYKLISLNENFDEKHNQESSNLSPKSFLINTADYGVPQHRERVFIVGIREDINPKISLKKSKETKTVRSVIGGLPKLRSGLSKNSDTNVNWVDNISSKMALFDIQNSDFEELTIALQKLIQISPKLSRGGDYKACQINTKTKDPLELFLRDKKVQGWLQHETRGHMDLDILRYFYCATVAQKLGYSPKLNDWQGNLNLLKPKHKNIRKSSRGLSSRVHSDRFKVQIWDKPSSTITSHISKDGHYFIHPDPAQARSLTVREACRLQTFPDNYFFSGPRTEQYKQVGNAVPPYFSFQLATAIKNSI